MNETIKIQAVSEKWFSTKARKFNQNKINEYLDHSPRLSPSTLVQYRSCLRIFAKWIHDYCKNKKIVELKIRDGKAYQDWLLGHNGSSTNVNVKLAAASELCEYIEKYYEEEFPAFRNPIRKGRERIVTTPRKEKKPLSPEEFRLLVTTLIDRQHFQRLCYLILTYQTACRRAESPQFSREIAGYTIADAQSYVDDYDVSHSYYLSNPIRCKGAGRLGKVRRFKISNDSMRYIKKWDVVRRKKVRKLGLRDDADGLFVQIDRRGVRNLTPAAFAYWFQYEFSEIIGRPIHPHDLRTSRATDLVVRENKPIEAVSIMMGHNSTETTQQFYVIDNHKDSDAVLL
ncbi:site-specific integrase [Loigolactobacillus coryniformis]|uniref:tyrosine-type recombinase/integrase n=1 Tax=Loigolactobacillus coryniformis TaxID=1610 RepID=UPI00201B2BF9|nr:site-specific integrase [Loigolactobacillus coryniformis]MCL5457605.1 site-specific integrase [Loigolactobacillus coryniformis]